MTPIILLDNFDSFTWNLVDQLRSNGHAVSVYRNDIDVNFLANHILSQATPSVLVLSPGPGTPQEAGSMMALIEKVAGKIPILGICLGHQALIEHYGGKIARAKECVHGKSSMVSHEHCTIFATLPNPLSVARYHSLVGVNIPSSLDVIATVDDMVMAIAHKKDKVVGFQFHPESILTEQGALLLTQTIAFLTDKDTPKC